MTPSLNSRGEIIGYHSNRRSPTDAQVAAIEPVYKALLAEETRHANAKDGLAASQRLLQDTIAKTGMPYEEFIFTV